MPGISSVRTQYGNQIARLHLSLISDTLSGPTTMNTNSLTLVSTIVDALRVAGIDIWVFGGWAEELRGLRPPGPHADVDLLVRATSFSQLEAVLALLMCAVAMAGNLFMQ